MFKQTFFHLEMLPYCCHLSSGLVRAPAPASPLKFSSTTSKSLFHLPKLLVLSLSVHVFMCLGGVLPKSDIFLYIGHPKSAEL